MVAAYYVALAGSQVGGSEEGETVRLRAALRALDLGLMLGGTSFRRQLLFLAEMIEAILEGKREAPAAAEPPPGASHAPAEPSVPLRALSGWASCAHCAGDDAAAVARAAATATSCPAPPGSAAARPSRDACYATLDGGACPPAHIAAYRRASGTYVYV